jgi:predicted nucleic acid-binding protein
MLVYLDSCCFSRPFTDMGIARNQRDASDFRVVMALLHTGRVRFACSNYLYEELSDAIPAALKRKLLALVPSPDVMAPQHSRLIDRVERLTQCGFDYGDAAHLACAESVEADFLLTTDDDFIELARQHATLLKVKVWSMHSWLGEVLDV